MSSAHCFLKIAVYRNVIIAIPRDYILFILLSLRMKLYFIVSYLVKLLSVSYSEPSSRI